MSRISRFYSRFSTFTLILFAIAALGVNRYRSQARVSISNSLTIVSAATFEETPLAPESIAVAFGGSLSSGTASATTVPLPTVLAGAGLKLKDSAGVEHNCGLFFVSPLQINFLVPAGVASGPATLTLTRTGGESSTGAALIAPVGPGLFSANSSGQGAATGFLLLAPERGGPSYEPLAQFDESRKQFVTRPIDLNRVFIQATRLFLVLYGSGIRGRGDLNSVKARIGGLEAPVVFAGAAPGLLGLDQINIPLETPLIRLLTGRGRVNIALSITDQRAGLAISNVIEIEVAGLSSQFAPVITGFEPARALAGDTVAIKGSRLSFGLGGNRVRVGGIEAQVLEATYSEIKIKVPFGAETGPVSVSNGQGEATNSGLTGSIAGAFLTSGSNVFIGSSAGVFVTSDLGRNWQPANVGLTDIVNIASLVSTGTNIFVLSTYNGIYRSSDQGKSWTPVEYLTGIINAVTLGVNGSTLFTSVSVRLTSPGLPTVYRSTDQGKSWTPANKGLGRSVPVAFAAIGSNTFAAASEGVFVTSNDGDSWTAANNGLPEKTALTSLVVSGSKLFAGTSGRGVYVSTDNGQNWTGASANLPGNAFVTTLFTSGSNLFVVTPTDEDSQCPLGSLPINGRCYGVGSLGFDFSVLGLFSGKVYLSTNNGRNWAPVNAGLAETGVSAMGASGKTVFAATAGRGVFTRQF
ncbi:MAG: IPT/TIG domain-containing protein [Blastocatellia bacterium]